MYKCQLCQEIVPAKTKSQRIIVETRPRSYPSRYIVTRRRGKAKVVDDPGGFGYEIVREVAACPACAAQVNSQRT